MQTPVVPVSSLLAMALLCGLVHASPASVLQQHHDDLLSAGLGQAGLRAASAPAPADPAAPTAAELRQRALWANWRGIADLAPGGGLGEFYGRFEPVPGNEYHALLTLPGARHPHRVMLQVPDSFGADGACLLVAASSGSRGIHGAIALAGGWGLPRGCAVVYTDKGAGTGWFDSASQRGARLDGTVGAIGDGLEFSPAVDNDPPRVLFKHAHSGDNPERDWGRHLRQAAEFALERLNHARGERHRSDSGVSGDGRSGNDAPLTFADLQVIAIGVSNGGGAVLRAAEIEGDWLDAAVAVAPNVWAGQGGRALYDVATEAALLMPCAMADSAFDGEPLARPGGNVPATAWARCERLHADGLLQSPSATAQAGEARQRLLDGGWTPRSLSAATLSTAFDLWRAVAAAYAAAYVGTGSAAMPCGYDYAMRDATGTRREATASEQALWWSDTSGIAPTAGVALIDAMATGNDPAYPGLACLRALFTAQTEAPTAADNTGDISRADLSPADASAADLSTAAVAAAGARTTAALRSGLAATRAGLPAAGLPLLVMHGVDDGLVPEAHTSAPYVAWARANGRAPVYWQIEHAQHFDGFLGMPLLASRYVPLLPYAWHGLDAMWAHLQHGQPLPDSRVIAPRPRVTSEGVLEPLTREHLRLP